MAVVASIISRARWAFKVDRQSIYGVISRTSSIGLRVVYLPLALTVLGPEGYGVWLVISSISVWVGLADFGIISAAQNPISRTLAEDDPSRAAALVRHLLRRLSLTAVIISLTFWIPLIALIYGAPEILSEIPIGSDSNRTEYLVILGLSLTTTAVILPCKIAIPLSFALKKAHIYYATEVILQIAAITSLLLASLAVEHRLLLFSIGFGAQQIVVMKVFLRTIKRNIRNTTGFNGSSDIAKDLQKQGWIFVLILIAESLILQSDPLLIALTIDTSNVTKYAVPFSLVMQFLIVQNIFIRPLWPRVVQAATNGSLEVAEMLKSAVIQTILCSAPVAVSLVFLGPQLLAFWTNGTLKITHHYAGGFALLLVVTAIANTLATFANALELSGQRLIAIVLFAGTKCAVGFFVLTSGWLEWLPYVYALIALSTDVLILYISLRRRLQLSICV